MILQKMIDKYINEEIDDIQLKNWITSNPKYLRKPSVLNILDVITDDITSSDTIDLIRYLIPKVLITAQTISNIIVHDEIELGVFAISHYIGNLKELSVFDDRYYTIYDVVAILNKEELYSAILNHYSFDINFAICLSLEKDYPYLLKELFKRKTNVFNHFDVNRSMIDDNEYDREMNCAKRVLYTEYSRKIVALQYRVN